MIPVPSFIGVNRAFVPPAAGPGIPVNIAPPVVTGTGYTGQTLNTTSGTWTNSPTGFSYQWQSNGGNILGATSSTYDVTSITEGTELRCVVTASNGAGSSLPENSNIIHNWVPSDTTATSFSWWDFSDSNQVSTSGSNITQIADKGNLAENLSQGTSANQPSLQLGVQNGLNVARFNRTAASDYLQGSSLSKYNFVHNGTDSIVATVIDMTEGLGSGPNRQCYAGTSLTGSAVGWGFRASDVDTINTNISNNSGTLEAFNATDYTALGSWSIINTLVDMNGPSSSRVVHRFDGTQSASTSSSTGAPSASNATVGLTMGSNPTAPGGSNNNLNGDVGELLIFNSQADFEEIEGYLAWKWGLVASLPGGHPYKTTPPTP